MASYNLHIAIEGVSYLDSSTGKRQFVTKPGVFVPLSAAMLIHRFDASDDQLTAWFPKTVSETSPRYSLLFTDREIAQWVVNVADPRLEACQALVSASENARMERYLAGTSSPLYDFLEELRYNPNTALGPALKRAATDFTMATASMAAAAPSASSPPSAL